jgi:hypothetical protein
MCVCVCVCVYICVYIYIYIRRYRWSHLVSGGHLNTARINQFIHRCWTSKICCSVSIAARNRQGHISIRVFERKVLRRIYAPTKEKDGTWRIKSNEELNRLTGNKNVINCIKAQRLAWFGHVHRMPDNSMVQKKYTSGHPH